MELMASKSEARQRVAALGIPVIPGSSNPDQDPDELERIADTIGYPLLIKASAGGGGLGIRVVNSRPEFQESLKAVHREAGAAFDDNHVLLE